MSKITFSRRNKNLDSYIIELVEELDLFPLKRKNWEPNDLESSDVMIFDLKDLQELDRLGELDLESFLLLDREAPAFLMMEDQDIELNTPEGDGLIALDPTKPIKFHLPILRTTLKGQMQSGKEKLGQNIEQLVSSSLRELKRIKRLHQALVPLREDKLKGLTVFSKYAAGEAPGGEFFDVIERDKDFLLVLSHSSSYVLTSMVISHISALRDSGVFSKESLEETLSLMMKDCSALVKESDFDFFIMKVDMKSLDVIGHSFGGVRLYSNKKFSVPENEYPFSKPFLEKSFFSGKLERGGRYLTISPGLIRNCDGEIDGKDIGKFIKLRIDDSVHDVLNDLIYQLKKGRDESFLKFDATVILKEVDSNVIIQV